MKQDIGKTGNAELVKVGHTFSGAYGSEPNAKRRGIAEMPTPQTFGSSVK